MSYETCYQNPYAGVMDRHSLSERLEHLYHCLQEQFSDVDRFSMALYTEQPPGNVPWLSTLATFGETSPVLRGYQIPLQDVPSLQNLLATGNIRVIHDMRQLRTDAPSEHTAALLAQGFRSSVTLPLFNDGQLFGVLFLNSRKLDYFTEPMVVYCALWGHLAGSVYLQSAMDSSLS